MIASCHIIAGAVIAERTQNPILGIFFAFLSHFVLDFIPHADYPFSREIAINKENVINFLKICIGAFAAFSIVFLLAENTLLAMAGGFAALSPDFATIALYLFPKNKFLRKIYYIHLKKIHLPENKFPLFLGISTQVLVILASFFLLLKR